MSSDQASDQLLASSHLLRDEIYIVDNINKIMEKSGAKFSPSQITSLLDLMDQISNIESPINEEQRKLISATQKYFAKIQKGSDKW